MTFCSIKFRALTAVLFSIVLLAGSSFAQTDTSSITGAVTDAQGAAVAGATVTINNPDRAFSRTTQTSAEGNYNFSGIPPGTYTVEVEKAGFKKAVQTNVVAAIASPATINLSLEIGDVSEIVTVSSDTIDSIVNTQDASIGNNFQTVQIQQLPTDSRNIN